MALETTVFDAVDYLTEPQDVFHYLDAEFEIYEPKFLKMGLETVLRARGGAERMALESGIPLSDLAGFETLDDEAARALATRIMEAYRPDASAKVA